MPITRSKKEEIIKDLHQKAERAKLTIFLNFHGLKAEKAKKLRQNLRKAGIDFKVAKKTLLKRVLGGLGIGGDEPEMEGEAASAFSYDESPEAAKIIKDFAKKHEGIKILGGIFEGKYVLADFIERLAAIPAREILLAQLAGVLNSPVSGFVRVLGGPINKMVGIIYQLSVKK